MRAALLALLIAILGGGVTVSLGAQEPVINRPLDSTKTDTLHKRKDTLSTTDRLLQVQKDARVELSAMPFCGVGTVEPGGTRIVIDRDSIDWAAAQDVGELLARVPGVNLERGDWLGSPVMPNYLGHGAASVEYVQDCVPMIPLGPDSVAFDPSSTPLGILDRVEIETSPSTMRVYLFTRRHDRQAPRTKIGASQGDRSAARYFASFERRYPSGLGLAIAADYLGVNAPTGGTGGAKIPSGWFQLGYVPSPTFGIQGQIITRDITRNLLLGEASTDTLGRQMTGSRTDAQLRASWRARADGLGASVDLIAAHSAWSSDSAPGSEGIGQYGGIVALRHPTWSAQLSSWHYTRWTSLDSRLDLGWAPMGWISASVELAAQRHDGNRRSQWSTGRLGIKLPLGFRVGGSISDGHRVQTPSLIGDIAQRYTDVQLTAGFDSHPLTLDAGYARDEGWRPQTYPEFVAIAGLAPLPQTDWITLHARYAPLGWFTLETVYEEPRNVLPDGTPPQHALSTATVRSRFLRNFPSGIFDLKLQAVVESWSPGIGGRTAEGNPIPLPGATFFRAIIQLQIGPFIAYYDRVNLRAVRTGYVPGYTIQPLGSTYGIRWEFSN